MSETGLTARLLEWNPWAADRSSPGVTAGPTGNNIKRRASHAFPVSTDAPLRVTAREVVPVTSRDGVAGEPSSSRHSRVWALTLRIAGVSRSRG
jgi:hypothetical protein